MRRPFSEEAMQRALVILVAVPGVLLAFNGLGWLFRPAWAAENLGMPLLDGVARSTQIGDLGAFFLGTSVLILVGVFAGRPQWLQGAALLVGSAALVRTIAWAFHGADLALAFIVPEIVMAAVLVFGAARIPARS
jgi:hypothetical protein